MASSSSSSSSSSFSSNSSTKKRKREIDSSSSSNIIDPKTKRITDVVMLTTRPQPVETYVLGHNDFSTFHDAIHRFCAHLCEGGSRRLVCVSETPKHQKYEPTDDNSKSFVRCGQAYEKCVYHLWYGRHTGAFENQPITVTYRPSTNTRSSLMPSSDELQIHFGDNGLTELQLQHFYDEAEKFAFNPKPGSIQVSMISSDDRSWHDVGVWPHRSMETIHLPSTTKTILCDDLCHFRTQKSFYQECGIAYKRCYLLYGPPGTGKTSLIYATASKLGYDVAVVSYDASMTDSSLTMLLSDVGENTFLVFEDIDCLFFQRGSSSSSLMPSGLSFAGLLTVLDGVAHQPGQVIFMTTNHLEHLDPALIRPGRVDKMIAFTNMKAPEIESMFRFLLPERLHHECKQFVKKTKSLDLSPALLQVFLVENRDQPSIVAELSKLKDLNKFMSRTQLTDQDVKNIDRMY